MDAWDQRYLREDYFYGVEPNRFLEEQAPRLRPGSQVLCLAEGEGRNACFLAGLGHEVTAIDSSPVGLEKLDRLAEQRGVSVESICADLDDCELEAASWDAIVAIWCHLPLKLRQSVHRQAAAALRPGGLFILEAYAPEQLQFGTGGPPTLDLLMDLATVQAELPGLEWLVAQAIERDVQEGVGHHGPSAVIQLVGRRP